MDDDEPYDLILNALSLQSTGAGVSTYIRELLRGLPEFVAGRIGALVGESATSEIPDRIVPMTRPTARGFRRALQSLRDPGATSVFHGLDLDLPLRRQYPAVTTVHDLAVFDAPWAFSRHKVIGERLVVRRAIHRADAIIAVSAFTAERISAIFGRESAIVPEAAGRHFVVPTPDEVERVRIKYHLPDEFVLHVGTLEPRKQVPQLAAACRELAVPLVAVGGSGWKVRLPESIQLLGFVPEDDLVAIYGAATVAAYLSVYEGFGLPPLEAMATGSAVVTTPVPSVRLVDAGIVVRAGDQGELVGAIRELVQDAAFRREVAEKGQRAVAQLNWRETARSTAAVYAGIGLHARREIA